MHQEGTNTRGWSGTCMEESKNHLRGRGPEITLKGEEEVKSVQVFDFSSVDMITP